MFLESAEVVEPGEFAVGKLADLRDSQFNFLRGHFPDFQVVPGAILMETLAELLVVAVVSREVASRDKIGVLVEDKMRYRQMVRPGDEVLLEARVSALRKNIGKGGVKATRGGQVVAEGELIFALIDKPKAP